MVLAGEGGNPLLPNAYELIVGGVGVVLVVLLLVLAIGVLVKLLRRP